SFKLTGDVFRREYPATRSGAASFEQVVGQIFDVGSQLVFFDLRGGQFGVARFAQQRAVFRHYLVEGRTWRRCSSAAAATARTFGSAAALTAFGARGFFRILSGAALRRRFIAGRPDQAQTDHEYEKAYQLNMFFHISLKPSGTDFSKRNN